MNSRIYHSIFRRAALLVSAACAVITLAASAMGALVVNISNPTQTANRGDIVTFQGSITNTGNTLQYLNGASLSFTLNGTPISMAAFELFYDDTPFATGAPTTLAPGANWSGPLFRITLGIDAPAATYAGTFIAQGGSDATQFNTLGSGGIQLTVNAPAAGAPPTAPSNLQAVIQSSTSVGLTWTDYAGDEDGFLVQRSANGGAWTTLMTTYNNASTYVDGTVQPGNAYRYRIQAHNTYLGNSYSGYSNVFFVSTPAQSTTIGGGDGAYGQYFNDTNGVHLSGTPALTRIDPTINFTWNGAQPDPAIGGTNFSVRWTGEIQAPTTDTYTFYTESDDGVMLTINGQEIINDWTTHGVTEDSATVHLVAGQFYTFELDYFQGTGPSQMQFLWANSTISKQIVPQSALFSASAPGAPLSLSASAVSGTQVNLSWTAGTGNVTGYEIQRKLGANGVYASIAQLSGAGTTYSDIDVLGDYGYVYRVQALNFAAASAYSNEAQTATPGAPFAPTNLAATVVSPTQVNLSWIDPSAGANVFSIERSANGGASWTVINPSMSVGTAYNDTTATAGGVYLYRVRAYDTFQGGAYSAYSNLFAASTPTAPFTATGDGALGTYYNDTNGQHLAGTPALVRVDPTINFTWNGAQPANAVGGTNFSVRWTGKILAPATDTYTFYTESDDGVMLYINGNLIITDWTNHAPAEDTATVQLQAGQLYTFEMDYFQGGGGSEAELLWSSSTITKQVIPQSQLFSGGGLNAPSNFAGTAPSTSQVSLTWSGNSPGANGYLIQRETAIGGSYAPIASLSQPAGALNDISLAPGTEYRYRIQSYNLGGSSAYTTLTTATLTAPPASLTATGANGSASLSWSPPPYNGTAANLTFKVYRGTSAGNETQVVASGLTSPHFSDSGLQNGSVYYYKVSAVDPGGESGPSAEFSVTPYYALSDFMSAYFTSAELQNPSISGLGADPNNDGVTNLMAYALNLNPRALDTGKLPVHSTQGGYNAITFTQRTQPTDVGYTVEVSTDLVNWSSGTGATTVVSTTPVDANTQTVTVRDNVPIARSNRRFIRLKVTH